MEIFVSSTNELKELAGKIAKDLHGGEVIALYGDLGAGKTTFTGFLVEAMGINARVQSPTFVLVREYFDGEALGAIKRVYHVDLYRLKKSEEVDELGLDEFVLDNNTITVIEWPELAEEALGEIGVNKMIKMWFEPLSDNENGRKIIIEGVSLE
jgi:tRNA threonylcarbamoyladenosine biosynthesis protein TsaE